jgi:hypothetical protein
VVIYHGKLSWYFYNIGPRTAVSGSNKCAAHLYGCSYDRKKVLQFRPEIEATVMMHQSEEEEVGGL